MGKKFLDINVMSQNPFYKLIKTMPKGILLHAHFGAMVNMIKFIDSLSIYHKDIYNNIYYVSDKQKIIDFNTLMTTIPGWNEKYKAFCVPFNLSSDFIYGLTYFPGNPPCEGYIKLASISDNRIRNDIISKGTRMQNVSEYDWEHLELYTGKYWSLIKNENIFELYTEFLLKEAFEDGLLAIELKSNLGGYHTKKVVTITDKEKTYQLYTGNFERDKEINILNTINTQSKTIKFKIIDGVHRGTLDNIARTKITLSYKCNSVPPPSPPPSHLPSPLVNSIDLFGEEDKGVENNELINELSKCHEKTNLTIHSGETKCSRTRSKKADNNKICSKITDSFTNTRINTNLNSIGNLKKDTNIIRVGHALKLCNQKTNNPCDHTLLDTYSSKKIHVELCPLSNYILDYITNNDFVKHPGNYYINTYNITRLQHSQPRLKVSINSDDPSIYGYDYVTYDWMFAIAFWNLSLEQIKDICLWSIKGSSFSDYEKIGMKKEFITKFDMWKNNLNSQEFNILKEQFKQLWNPEQSLAGGYYEQKYLKYKMKYLELKNKLS
jgi:hypothetical protein